LQVASSEGHVETVRILLEAGFSSNATSKWDGGHALQAAAKNGHQSVVALLLNRGAYIDHIHMEHGTALRASALGGHSVLVNLLLEHGADVNIHDLEHGSVLQATVLNRHIDTASLLIDRGTNINVRGGRETTLCCEREMARVVRRVIDHPDLSRLIYNHTSHYRCTFYQYILIQPKIPH
jgi:ankyrin repeat protein